MPSKKRKARRPNIPLHTGPVPLESSAPGMPAPVRSAAREVSAPRPSANPAQIKSDYTYVINDLKRIAIIGGGLIVALVVLSLFIR